MNLFGLGIVYGVYDGLKLRILRIRGISNRYRVRDIDFFYRPASLYFSDSKIDIKAAMDTFEVAYSKLSHRVLAPYQSFSLPP